MSGANAWLGGVDVQVQISGRWLLAYRFNAGAAEDDRSLLFKEENIYIGSGITAAYETPVGPAELTFSGSERNNSNFWFSFGYRF